METITIKLPSIEQVEFTFEALEEDIPVRGNYMATGDPQLDRALEDEVKKKRDAGDIFAWFCAAVTARWKGLKATSYIGGCSYEDEQDFKKEHYEDMKEDAFKDLIDCIKALAK